MNKKIIIVVGIILVIILLIITSSIKPKEKLSNDPNIILSNAEYESENVKENELKELNEINLKDYFDMYNNKSREIVLIGKPTCGYCEIAIPIIENINYEYNLNINYLDIAKLTEDENNEFINSNELYQEDFGTPILVIIGNKKIYSNQSGLTDHAHYVKLLKDNKLIK